MEIFTLGPLHVNTLLMLVLGLLENALDVLVGGLFVCFSLGRYKEVAGIEK